MPPWGSGGVLKPEDIVQIVAFLDTQRAPLPPEKDPERDPATRTRPVGFGDNLDPTNNPAVLRAEGADALWSKKGPSGKACADCHAGGALEAMKGVATRYPQFVAKYGRVMFKKGSSVLERLDSLKKFAGSSVGYTVCSNTMKAMQVERQDIVELVDDFYPGIVRVVELQEKGYVYLRP